ncbi:hypothetical protein TRFO_02912 [Tritrichomonas foetus]|uniref:Uncharacterized protein n=1 Tax=Tritrichomonas foetus TaxID=1144522 RepID=A0A1J4L110_9EUKA|nr:hypothetical protein TRFO_02912 [Tritrichomonas foetus]|eukprot:OHT15565.1 hypothetical protein TRFO_02912 [Tritrichomonas foetus]
MNISHSILLLTAGVPLGLSLYFDCRGIRVIKPVSLFAYLMSLISLTINTIIFLISKYIFNPYCSRERNTEKIPFSYYFHKAFIFLTLPSILHYISLPSIRSNTMSMCAPYGLVVLYIYILFSRRQITLSKFQSIFLVSLFFSFFILFGQILHRSIDEENPLLSILKLLCGIFKYGIVYIFKLFNNDYPKMEVSFLIFIHSLFATVFFLLSSFISCELENIIAGIIQMLKVQKTWHYISAILQNVVGLHSFLHLMKKNSQILEFVPYVLFLSGLPFAFTELDEWEYIDIYEQKMRLFSMFLIGCSFVFHVISMKKK